MTEKSCASKRRQTPVDHCQMLHQSNMMAANCPDYRKSIIIISTIGLSYTTSSILMLSLPYKISQIPRLLSSLRKNSNRFLIHTDGLRVVRDNSGALEVNHRDFVFMCQNVVQRKILVIQESRQVRHSMYTDPKERPRKT